MPEWDIKTELGLQEWLAKAMRGNIPTPTAWFVEISVIACEFELILQASLTMYSGVMALRRGSVGNVDKKSAEAVKMDDLNDWF